MLERVERAVDLDRRKGARGEFQLAALRKVLRIEHAAPGRVTPARNADTNGCRHDLTAASNQRTGPTARILQKRADCGERLCLPEITICTVTFRTHHRSRSY